MRTWDISRADLIPENLRDARQWVCWRVEVRNGKPTKPPVKVGGGYASSTDPMTWSSFDEVCEEYEADESLAGIGFMLRPGGDLTAIDLDHVLDDSGDLEPWARAVLDTVHTYTEVSPSGHGLHLWAKARLPGPAIKTRQIELYDGTSGRYLTVTGRLWRPERYGLDTQSRSSEIAAVYQQYAPHKGESAPSSPTGREAWRNMPLVLHPDAVPPFHKLELLKEIDTKFAQTWARNRPDLADQSASTYCLSLATVAASVGWTPQEMANLLIAWRKKSGEDAKLDRLDWYQRTIARAIESAGVARQQDPEPAPPEPPPEDPSPDDPELEEPEPPPPEDPEPEVPGAGGAPLTTENPLVSEDARAEALKTLRSILGLSILRYYQIGLEGAQYRVELSSSPRHNNGGGATSYTRRVGAASAAIEQETWRTLAMESMGRPFAKLRPGEWQRILGLLALILEYQTDEGSTSSTQALREHLEDLAHVAHDETQWEEAARVGLPFVKGGFLHMSLAWLLRVLRGRSAERWLRPEVVNGLAALEWETVKVNFHHADGRRDQLRAWRRRV